VAGGEEAPRVLVAGFGEEPGGGAVFAGHAGFEDERLVADRFDQVQVVAEEDHGHAVRGREPQFGGHAVAVGGVLAGGRLVRDEEPRLLEEGVGEHEPLLLPARELVREAAQEGRVFEPDPAHRVGDALAGAFAAAHLGDVAQDAADAPHRIEHRRRMLRQVRGGHFGWGAMQHVDPGDFDRAGRGDTALGRPEQGRADGGLARPGSADDRERAPGVEREAHVADEDLLPGGGGQVRDANGHGRSLLDSRRSNSRFKPTDSATSSAAGSTTPHGDRKIPPRFTSTITAQSLASGPAPTPRKLAAATR
jgi:hypothetical protein